MLAVRKAATAAILLSALGLAGSGCVDNESSLYIEGVLAIETTDCVARPEGDAAFRQGGVLDVVFGGGYRAALQVGNQITEQGNREKLRTETSRLHIEGASVTVFVDGGATLSFETAATGFAHPAAGTDPGLSAVFVQLIQPGDTDAVLPAGATASQVIARVQVYGTTLGGQEIESGEFDFPILVCRGCLVSYPIGARDPMSGAYVCGTDAAIDDFIVCRLGQDAPIPCTLCAETYDECQSPDNNPWYN